MPYGLVSKRLLAEWIPAVEWLNWRFSWDSTLHTPYIKTSETEDDIYWGIYGEIRALTHYWMECEMGQSSPQKTCHFLKSVTIATTQPTGSAFHKPKAKNSPAPRFVHTVPQCNSSHWEVDKQTMSLNAITQLKKIRYINSFYTRYKLWKCV